MAVLLTNVEDFSAHVVIETRSSSNQVTVVSGELLGRRGKLLFAPESDSSVGKRLRAGGISFIWDVAGNSGYLLSEALQGYAPIFSTSRFTNVVANAGSRNLASEKIDGRPCEQEEAIVASSDGSTATFHVWRATDLKGFPMRLRSTTTSMSLVVSLSKARWETLPDGLFLPPDGFTKYDNPEAMMHELAARQQNARRKVARGIVDTEAVGGRQGRRY